MWDCSSDSSPSTYILFSNKRKGFLFFFFFQIYENASRLHLSNEKHKWSSISWRARAFSYLNVAIESPLSCQSSTSLKAQIWIPTPLYKGLIQFAFLPCKEIQCNTLILLALKCNKIHFAVASKERNACAACCLLTWYAASSSLVLGVEEIHWHTPHAYSYWPSSDSCLPREQCLLPKTSVCDLTS